MGVSWKIIVGLFGSLAVGLVGITVVLGVTGFFDKGDNMAKVYAQPVTPTVSVKPISNTPNEEEEVLEDYVEEPIEVEQSNHKKYFLVLGVDAREDTLVGRSDAMVVASLDKENGKMDLLSIPRDAYVTLLGDDKRAGSYDKITHAHAFGGADMAKQTVEGLLGIKIDNHVVFNFDSFVSIIDQIGGIEIDVQYAFCEQDSSGKKNAICLDKGLQTLSGEEALSYARMRKKDPTGDIGRGQRQQEIIKATYNRLGDISVSEYKDLYTSIKSSMNTDISLLDIASTATYVGAFKDIETHTLKGKGANINGVYYFQLEEASLSDIRGIFQN